MITIDVTDCRSKYGRPKRVYHAVCTCGWEDEWWPVVKAAAVEHGDEHIRAAHTGATP